MPKAALAFAGVILLSSCCYGRIFPDLALAFLAVGVPWALITFAVGRRTRARHMAISLVLIAAGALSGIALDHFKGAGLAMRNERLIIPAVDHFRADHGRYPDSLNELVPRYLPSTRPAGTPLLLYRIDYWRHGDDASLALLRHVVSAAALIVGESPTYVLTHSRSGHTARFGRSFRACGPSSLNAQTLATKQHDAVVLVVTVMVPFGRRTWAFKARRAGYLD